VIEAASDVEVGLLILNAGADSNVSRFLDADFRDLTKVLDLNVTAPLRLIHHFGPAMRERRRGGIVMVGSLAGDLGTSHHAVYGGAKAFGRIFAESLWLELREHGVHVLDLVLGVTRTPAMTRAGLNFDLPGMRVSEPMDVAREGLGNLPHGPVRVAGGNGDGAAFRADPDRAKVVLKSHRMTQRLATVKADR
jgi:short-subunit dehydrogenase